MGRSESSTVKMWRCDSLYIYLSRITVAWIWYHGAHFPTTVVLYPYNIAKMYSSNIALYTLIPFLSLLRPIAADTCSQVSALNTVELKRQLSLEYSQEQQST
jgi:hypothetical protein